MAGEVRLAVVGCGNLGALHAGNCRRVEGVRPIAFADAQEAAAQTLAAGFADSYATADVARVWRDDDVDAVLICTHHDSHPDLAVAAAEAGKHVFVEKPLALTVAECERIEAAVARAGVQLMVGFKMRFMPLIQEVRRRLPRPLLLVGQMMDGRWGDTHWAQDPRTGGGNVLSQGVHNLDLLWYLAGGGEPESVYAAGGTLTHRDTEVIDNVFGTIRFRPGCVAALLNGDAGRPSFTSKFFYEVFDGTRIATLYDRCHRASFDGPDGGELRAEEAFPDQDPEGFVQELAEFVECVRNNRPPVIGATARDGTRATRLVHAAFESVRGGNVVRLP